MKRITMYDTQIIDGRQVEVYRTGYQKFTITYPEGADVHVEYVGNVQDIGERPVINEDDIHDEYFWNLPIAPHLLEPKRSGEIG